MYHKHQNIKHFKHVKLLQKGLRTGDLFSRILILITENVTITSEENPDSCYFSHKGGPPPWVCFKLYVIPTESIQGNGIGKPSTTRKGGSRGVILNYKNIIQSAFLRHVLSQGISKTHRKVISLGYLRPLSAANSLRPCDVPSNNCSKSLSFVRHKQKL